MVYHHKQAVNHSLGHNPPYLILKGGQIVDVQSGRIVAGDVVIKGKRIVGLGDDVTPFSGGGTEVVDVRGKYLLPGFIEPHIHIESSMLTLTNFARVTLPRGTATVINDPHEIANVLGIRGVRQMMDEGHYTPLRFYFTVPSCVPTLSEEFETAGVSFELEDIKALLLERDAIGLGEMMNYPGVIAGDSNVLAKIYEAYRVRGFKKLPPIIDGHAPSLSGLGLSAYINAGIMADHECNTGAELEERLRKGMYVMVRNGSSARNMETLLGHVMDHGIDTRRLMFCADDRNPFDLVHNGHIDETLTRATRFVREAGGRLGAVELIRMATLNAAEFFHMPYRGRLGIGTRADVAVVDDLVDFRVAMNFRNGELAARDGEMAVELEDYPYRASMLNSVHIAAPPPAEAFVVRSAVDRQVRAIGMIPGQLVTERRVRAMKARGGAIEPDLAQDLLKIVVIERHRGRNNFAVGFVQGFGIKRGAIAATIGHDSHNVGVIGANDQDIAAAIAAVTRLQGGVVVVDDGNVLAALELRVGGLMSVKAPAEVVREKIAVYDAYRQLGGQLKDPIVAMSFLQLPVIPALKISDISLIEMTPNGPAKVPLFVD